MFKLPNPTECNCGCHRNYFKIVEHSDPCCGECPYCALRIVPLFLNEHIKNCPQHYRHICRRCGERLRDKDLEAHAAECS